MMSNEHDFLPGPDLNPLYPTPQNLTELLDGSSPLTMDQRQALVAHALSKAVLFADITLLNFILRGPLTRSLIDLSVVDEDGLGLVSQGTMLFGEESDKDVEREECLRLLISEGADVSSGDAAGWTPLHFAALHAPPTLISHLLTHGASPLAKSDHGLTPLDVITAYEALPHRANIALLLEESMREQGWFGNEKERRRERIKRQREMHRQKIQRRRDEWTQIGRVLDLPNDWWGEEIADANPLEELDASSSDSDEEDSDEEPAEFTPPHSYESMLVFSLHDLPQLLDSLIGNARPVLQPMTRRSAPANGLYYLARFACIWCDLSWLEDLVVGVVDKIEDTVHLRAEDLSYLSFWLFNTTLFLHLLACDAQVRPACDDLELFDLLDELINSIFVFVIRIAEKKIDPLITPGLLDYAPLAAEFETVQFESEWSFLRSLTPRRKPVTSPPNAKTPSSPGMPPNTSSSGTKTPSGVPSTPNLADKAAMNAWNRLRSSISAGSPNPNPSPNPNRRTATPPPTVTPPNESTISPTNITTVLTAVHTLLALYGINPALIIQANSQILFWTSCELFNRLISQKKYLCRSKAVQISMNVGVVEECVTRIGLPRSVANHLAPVRQLLSWLQCLSAINDFSALVDTIQTMKGLNPLQLRRAVKDYRYEVSEGRMTDECNQYLAQMQKDWERQRIKLGVELARKERRRDKDEDMPSSGSEEAIINDAASRASTEKSKERDEAQRSTDNLFDPDRPKSEWVCPKPPEALGELMNSKYMLPLVFPTDPKLLCAAPGDEALHPPLVYTAGMDALTFVPMETTPFGTRVASSPMPPRTAWHSRAASRAGSHASHGSVSSLSSVARGPMRWKDQTKAVREVDFELLDLVGGVTPTVWDVWGVRFLNTDMVVEATESTPGWTAAEEGEEVNGQAPEGLDVTVLSNGHAMSLNDDGVTPMAHHPADGVPDVPSKSADTQSISSHTSSRSHLTPNLPRPTAEKRRSIRLARRSSGGDTIMPPIFWAQGKTSGEAWTDRSFEDTPTSDQPVSGFA